MAELILEIVEGAEPGRQTKLGTPVEIGRDESTDIALDDDQASRRHARVSAQGDLALLEDLGSTNGTYVNGQPIEGPRVLRPGDKIRVGLTVFELRTAQDVQRQPSAVLPVPAGHAAQPGRARAGARARARAGACAGAASAPGPQRASAPPAFATEETAPGFVPAEVADDEQARSRLRRRGAPRRLARQAPDAHRDLRPAGCRRARGAHRLRC